jgi:hypothetical protein
MREGYNTINVRATEARWQRKRTKIKMKEYTPERDRQTQGGKLPMEKEAT